MNRTVMIPVDGSERAERAIPIGVYTAARASATLRLIHVHDRTDGGMFQGVDGAERYMKGLVDRWRHHAPIVTGDVMQGDVASTLRHECAARETGWLVMTAGGAGGERQGPGRTSTALLAGPGAPIVLCGPTMSGVHGMGRVDDGRGVRTVGIVLEGSAAEIATAVAVAVRFARLHGACIMLMAVAPAEPDNDARAADIEKRLDALAERLDEADLPVSRRVVRSRDVAGGVLRAALEENVDVISLGRDFVLADPAATAVLVAARQPLLV